MQRLGPARPVHQFAAAVGTAIIERVGAFGAEGALERTEERPRCLGGQVRAATLAIGAHLKHCGDHKMPRIVPSHSKFRTRTI